MDWIEKLTGFDPDHGNGTLELTIFLIVLAIILATSVWLWSRRSAGTRRLIG